MQFCCCVILTQTIEEVLFAKLLPTFFEKRIVLVGTIFYVFQPFSYFYIGISLSVFYLFVKILKRWFCTCQYINFCSRKFYYYWYRSVSLESVQQTGFFFLGQTNTSTANKGVDKWKKQIGGSSTEIESLEELYCHN